MNSRVPQKRKYLSFDEGEVSISLSYLQKNPTLSPESEENYDVLRDVMIKERNHTLFVFLKTRPRSYWECEQKLIKAQFLLKEIQEGLDFFEQKGWIDDRKFAQFLLDGTQSYRAMGFYGIRHKLREKRIASSIIEEILAKHSERFLEDGKILLEKQMYRFERYEGWKKTEKMKAYLHRRGFSGENIDEILRKI